MSVLILFNYTKSKMFDVNTYNNFIMDLFRYSAVGTELVAMLCAVLAFVIPTRRSDFFQVTLMFLIDFTFIFLSNYCFSLSSNNPPVIPTQNENPIVVRGLIISTIWGIYLLTRLTYFILVIQKDNFRYEQLIVPRTSHSLQSLFPSVLIVVLVLQLVTIILLILYGLSLFLCPPNMWSVEDGIDIRNARIFLNKTSSK